MWANYVLRRGYATMIGAVGGVAELPDVEGSDLDRADSSSVEYRLVAGVAAAVVAGVVALGSIACYSRSRRPRR